MTTSVDCLSLIKVISMLVCDISRHISVTKELHSCRLSVHGDIWRLFRKAFRVSQSTKFHGSSLYATFDLLSAIRSHIEDATLLSMLSTYQPSFVVVRCERLM
jgi:hypothetical protein